MPKPFSRPLRRGKRAKRSSGNFWNDTELAAAVDAYLYMRQLEVCSISFSAAEHSKVLLDGPLHSRNEASVRYRMRNISHVLIERGEQALAAFSPAPQVGRNVKKRLNAILDARHATLRSISELKSQSYARATAPQVLKRLKHLKDKLQEIEPTESAGIGHNNPPGSFNISESDMQVVLEAVQKIEQDVTSDNPDQVRIGLSSATLTKFGLRIAMWMGERVTDFAKAGAVAAGTGTGLAISGLGREIVETLGTLFGWLM
ncbi:MAG: hypothetical protein ACTS1Z_15050 [Parasphingopyxis sp.]|uniref:hypothetical protein n=1 Tax=Parasphingopyxis sp. TaxID=1920299 RepID=UPI003FA0761C